MTRRTSITLALVAVLIAVGLGIFKFKSQETPAATPAAASAKKIEKQTQDVVPSAADAAMAVEQVPQHDDGGFVPPPSDATGVSPPKKQ